MFGMKRRARERAEAKAIAEAAALLEQELDKSLWITQFIFCKL